MICFYALASNQKKMVNRCKECGGIGNTEEQIGHASDCKSGGKEDGN